MLSKAGGSLPIILLITDGAVEDEKDICEAINARLVKGGLTTPRISTFGIGEVLVILLHRFLPHCFILIAFDLTIVGLMTSSLPHAVRFIRQPLLLTNACTNWKGLL